MRRCVDSFRLEELGREQPGRLAALSTDQQRLKQISRAARVAGHAETLFLALT